MSHNSLLIEICMYLNQMKMFKYKYLYTTILL